MDGRGRLAVSSCRRTGEEEEGERRGVGCEQGGLSTSRVLSGAMQGVCLHGQMKMNTCVEESYPLPPMPNMQHNAVVSSASLGDYDQITAQSGGLQCFTTKLGTQWSGFQPQPASVPGDLQLQVAMSQDSLRPHAPPCHSGMDKATKKRKIRSKAGEDDKDWAKNAGTLRLPEVVATLAAGLVLHQLSRVFVSCIPSQARPF
jgi:hypothetical protein